ncbi:MAG: YcgN family cysteine cluster protein [Desulfobacteraceae bacterium]|nr:YcgN family cysteine cluster protein [Desulfobacteraceae bacterium]
MADSQKTFWKTKSLSKMSKKEWESLCDCCGLCCLRKFEDENSGEVFYTNVACFMLDIENCTCTSYKYRAKVVPDCLTLTPARTREYHWLPETCAYRLILEGKELEWWHPLVSGDENTVHEAGISVRNQVISETEFHSDHTEDSRIEWEFRKYTFKKKSKKKQNVSR